MSFESKYIVQRGIRRDTGKKLRSYALQAKETEGKVLLSLDSIFHMGRYDSYCLGATDNDWHRVLSEELGTQFNVERRRNKYPMGDLRVFRLGELIFEVGHAGGCGTDGGCVADPLTASGFVTDGGEGGGQ